MYISKVNKMDELKTVWSYSIYGDDFVTYYKPVISNIQLARQEGALVAISAMAKDESKIRQFFKEYESEIKIVIYDDPCFYEYPKLLRFLISEALQADFYFFKDSDSVVTKKELRIMKEWMESSTPAAMIIRDHPLHVAPVMAGMFGVTPDISRLLIRSAKNSFCTRQSCFQNPYSYDQDWLMNDVYPWLVKRADVYSSFLFYSGENVIRIKKELDGTGFIGAQIHSKNPYRLAQARFYRLYGDGFLCAPSFLRHSFLYGRVRPTLFLAYINTKFKKIFKLKT